jgi:tetratricopeptide (TPR) repeat protein
LKNLSHHLQPYREVFRLSEAIVNENFNKIDLKVGVLMHLISYAEHQLGDRVPGNCRERENGERINNYEVEIEQLIGIYCNLANIYLNDESLGMISSGNLRLPLYEKVLDLLRPWCADLDSNSTGRIDSINKDQINKIFFLSAGTETNTALTKLHLSQFNEVETHCQRSLSYARLYEGTEDEKTDLLVRALKVFYNLRKIERNYDEALIFAEEAYNCVAVAFNPVHPKVQEAASTLIECLIHKGDLSKAELFAQMTLDSLKDSNNGLDQQSEAMAKGYYDLANVINEQRADLVKAENLARESLRIRVLIEGSSYNRLVAATASLLASILMRESKLGSETKELLERVLSISIRNYGLDGANTANAYMCLGLFHCQLAKVQQTVETRKINLHVSEIKIKEALRIYTVIYGSDDPSTLGILSDLSSTLSMLSGN